MKISDQMDLYALSVHMGDGATTEDARVMRGLLASRHWGADTADLTEDEWLDLCENAVQLEQPQDDHEVHNPHTDTWRTVKV